MDYSQVLKHYSNPEVIKEVFDYCYGKWVALEGKVGIRRVFVRHFHGKPLEFKFPSDIKRQLLVHKSIRPRTIYASINIYKELNETTVKDPSYVLYTSPIIDIDGNLEEVDLIIRVADILISEIEKYGIQKSLFLKWSGRGLHLHIHEKCFSKELREKYNPIDISYAIVEFLLESKKDELLKVIKLSKNEERPLKVENKIDIQRVFTAPLSLHRELDLTCVCFKPDDLWNFSLDWANPLKYRHRKDWREYEEGEGDRLAEIALSKGYRYLPKYFEGIGKKAVSIPEIRREVRGKIGRFQVMALLQAARYYKLKGNLEKAKSFGLNRAIFYAWAKYHKPRYGMSKRKFVRELLGIEEKGKFENVGDEQAPVSERGWFMMGDQEQLPQDYDRQIAEKIEKVIPYEIAWEAALEYVSKFPEHVLKSQRDFFELVYKPIRDKFFEIIKKYRKGGKIKE